MSRPPSSDYALDQPLPPSVVVGGSARLTRYRQYPVFSWPWLRGRNWLALALVSAWALLNGVGVGVVARSAGPGLQVFLHQFLAFMLMATAGPALATWVRHRRLPRARETVAITGAVLAGMLISGVIDIWASAKVTQAMAQVPALAKSETALDLSTGAQRISLIINSMVLLAIYALLGGGWALRAWFSERRRWDDSRKEQQISRLQIEKQQASLRLSALQARIEPHFLFNTLASVRALITTDPAAAEEMLDAITAYLRASIPHMRSDDGALHSTLGQQLDLCASYLELMRLRLGQRLQYAIEAGPELRSLSYPPLLLITMVENAIQHGIEPQPGPGRITLRAERDGQMLQVSVIDDGAGLQAGMGGGVGLANVREQLAAQFGQRASLKLSTGADGTHAVIRTPLEEGDD